MTNPTERELSDRLADALEWIAKEPDIDANGMRETAQAALTAYRAQRDGEKRYRMLIPDKDYIVAGDELEAAPGVWIKYTEQAVGTPFTKAHRYSRRPLVKGEAERPKTTYPIGMHHFHGDVGN